MLALDVQDNDETNLAITKLIFIEEATVRFY